MKKNFMRKKVKISVLIFLVLTIVITFINPPKPAVKLPPDLFTPIVALELAETPQEVFAIIGDTPDNNFRTRFFWGTIFDFLYILSYLAAYFILGKTLKKNNALQASQFYGLMVVLFVLAISDFLENYFILNLLQMPYLKMTGESTSHQLIETIFWLGRTTYLKWGTLGLASGIMAAGLVRYGKRKVAILFAAAFAASLVGLFFRSSIELMMLALGGAWPWVFVKTLPLKAPWFVASPDTKTDANTVTETKIETKKKTKKNKLNKKKRKKK